MVSVMPATAQKPALLALGAAAAAAAGFFLAAARRRRPAAAATVRVGVGVVVRRGSDGKVLIGEP